MTRSDQAAQADEARMRHFHTLDRVQQSEAVRRLHAARRRTRSPPQPDSASSRSSAFSRRELADA